MGIARGLLGLAVMIGIAWLFSSNRKAINWRLVFTGLALQLVLAIAIFYVPFVADGFSFLGKMFVKVTDFTAAGTAFLFNSFVTQKIEVGLINFAITILPTIIFFSALTSLLYYLGVLQWIVYGMAWVMRRTMGLSGAESLAAAGNVFLGQTESPFLIKPYLERMTRSEMMCLMTGGMATVAGGVLAVYVGFLGGDDPVAKAEFAKHLLAASVMSAPAAIVAAKILVPETEDFDRTMEINREKMGVNALEAIVNGTTEGVKLAVNVGAMLLVFIAFVYGGNYLLGLIGGFTGLNSWIAANTAYDAFSFQFMMGYIFAPITWLMGVDSADILIVGQLLGEKTILNELVAYNSLAGLKDQLASERSLIMATYLLCGFANISSIGIQIGGIGTLVPGRKGMLSQLGVKSLIGGTMACMFTAIIVGMLI